MELGIFVAIGAIAAPFVLMAVVKAIEVFVFEEGKKPLPQNEYPAAMTKTTPAPQPTAH